MKTIYFLIIVFLLALLLPRHPGLAQADLAKRLSGRILLRVAANGQAWYVNPLDLKKYYLGRPADAFNLMRRLGTGITNQDLAKIPDKNGARSDSAFAKSQAGKILLQTQGAGESWYINPLDLKRYYLGRPADAFSLMRRLALGINETDINKIPIGYISLSAAPAVPGGANPEPVPADQAKQTIDMAASAIRSGNTATAEAYFTPEIKKLVDYTMSVLGSDGKLSLGNMMSASKLKTSTDNEKIYATEIYVGIVGRKVEVKFRVKKQPDGSWLIANL